MNFAVLVFGALFSGAVAIESFVADVREISVCGEDDKTVMLMKDVSVDRAGGNEFLMNATMIVKKDIPGPMNITCLIERCLSEDKPDSCEYHTKYVVNSFCDDIGKRGKLWSSFIEATRIKKECPLRKGEYRFSKYRIALSLLEPLALSRPFRVFWKIITRVDSIKYPNAMCLKIVCALEPKNRLKVYNKKNH